MFRLLPWAELGGFLQNQNYSGFFLCAFGSVGLGLLAVIGGLKLAGI